MPEKVGQQVGICRDTDLDPRQSDQQVEDAIAGRLLSFAVPPRMLGFNAASR
jgi:hypothetical protein